MGRWSQMLSVECDDESNRGVNWEVVQALDVRVDG